MSQADHIKKLIINNQRRLQKLNEQRALLGIATDPEILIEIEDIEAELGILRKQLEQQPQVYNTSSPFTSRLASLPISPFFAHAQASERYWANRYLELDLLTKFWMDNQVSIVGLIGWGGVGKSSLARCWFDQFTERDIKPDGFFWWSFYYQASFDEFLETILLYLTGGTFQPGTTQTPWAKTQQVITLLQAGRFIVVLDGLEVMQTPPAPGNDYGKLSDRAFRNFLELCSDTTLHQSFILVTSRFPLTDLQLHDGFTFRDLQIDYFSDRDGAEYLKKRGVRGTSAELRKLSNEYGGHALSLSLLSGYLNQYYDGKAQYHNEIPSLATTESTKVKQILQAYYTRLTETQRAFLILLSAFRRPIDLRSLKSMLERVGLIEQNPLLKPLSTLTTFDLMSLISNLKKQKLIFSDEPGETYTAHPLVREYFYFQLSLDKDLKRKVNLQLRDLANEKSIPQPPKRLEDFTPLFDSTYYSCQAGFFDEAARNIYENYLIFDASWNIGYLFGAFEFQISFLRQFFHNGDVTQLALVKEPKAISFLIFTIGQSHLRLGHYSECKNFCQNALKTFADVFDYKAKTLVNGLLAQAKTELGELNEAFFVAQEYLKYARLANFINRERNALAVLGWISFLKGDVSVSDKFYREAVAVKNKESSNKGGLFSILGVQHATFLLATGQIEQSLEKTQQNLAKCKELGWQESVLFCEKLLGDIALVNKNIGEASQRYSKTLEIARNLGFQQVIARTLLAMAKISIAHSEFDEALANLVSSMQIANQLDYNILKADIFNHWAELRIEENDLIAAREQSQKGLELSKRMGYASGQGTALYNLGRIELLNGERSKARNLLQKACEIRQITKDPQITMPQQLLNEL